MAREVPEYVFGVLGRDGLPVGAGILVGDSYAVSALHVLEDALGADVSETRVGVRVRIGRPGGGIESAATILQCNAADDLVLLSVEEPWTTTRATLQPAGSLRERSDPAQFRIAGAALIEGRNSPEWMEISAAWEGLVGKRGRVNASDIQPGLSGGPLIRSADGSVRGVLCSRHHSSDDYFEHVGWIAPAEQIWEMLREDDAALPELVALDEAAASPYKGLAPFEIGDSHLFFGREPEVARLTKQVVAADADGGVLFISGSSGVGKSSLVRAGLIPDLVISGLSLAQSQVEVIPVTVTISEAILDDLAKELSKYLGGLEAAVAEQLHKRPRSMRHILQQVIDSRRRADKEAAAQPRADDYRVVIFIDQFERMFTDLGPQLRRVVLAVISSAVGDTASRGPATVLLAVRSDYEPECAAYPEIEVAVDRNHRCLIKPMTKEHLRHALLDPARAVGGNITPELLTKLLADMQLVREASDNGAVASPSQLPFVCHALDQAWRHSKSTTIDLIDYEAVGGAEAAVEKSAEGAYENLSDSAKTAAPTLFGQLFSSNELSSFTARRVLRSHILEVSIDRDATSALIDAFVNARILRTLDMHLEVAHESIWTSWTRLRGWLAAPPQVRILVEGLRRSTAEWASHGRSAEYLYGRDRLAAARESVTLSAPWPSLSIGQAEQEFLAASDAAMARGRRRTAYAISAMALALVVIGALAVFYRDSSVATARELDRAVAAQLVSLADATADGDPEKSRLQTLSAWSLDPSSNSRSATRRAIARPGLALLRAKKEESVDVTLTSDGRRAIVGAWDGVLEAWDLTRREKLPNDSPKISDGTFYGLTAIPDSDLIAAATGDARVVVLSNDGSGFGKPRFLAAADSEPLDLIASPNGEFLVGMDYYSIQMWRISDGKSLGVADMHRAVARARQGDEMEESCCELTKLAFSPRGDVVVGTTYDGYLQFWRAPSLQLDGPEVRVGQARLTDIAFSADATRFVVSSDDGSISLWNASTRKIIVELQGASTNDDRWVGTSLAFTADGKTVAAGGDDGSIRVWDITSGRELDSQLRGHTNEVTSLTFVPESSWLLSASAESIRLWTPDTPGSPTSSLDIKGKLDAMEWSASQNFGFGLSLGRVSKYIFDPSNRRLSSSAFVDSSGGVLKISHAGEMLLAQSNQVGFASLWKTSQAAEVVAPLDLTNKTGTWASPYVVAAAFDMSDKQVAVATPDSVHIWQVGDSGPTNVVLNGVRGDPWMGYGISNVGFSARGELVTVSSSHITWWSVPDLEQVHSLPLTVGGIGYGTDFSSDGRRLAVIDDDGALRIIDLQDRRDTEVNLTQGSGTAHRVRFSSNPDVLAVNGTTVTGRSGEFVRFWDIETASPLGNSTAYTTEPGSGQYTMAFAGSLLVTSGADEGLLQVWNVPEVGAPGGLCDLVGRGLSEAEWKSLVPPGPKYRQVC